MSTATPGYVFQCQAPPTPSPSSTMTKSRKPASSSLMATPMPESPPPMTTTSWSGAVDLLMRSVPPRSSSPARAPLVLLGTRPDTVLASTDERKGAQLSRRRAQPQLEARRRARQGVQARAVGLRERAGEVQADARPGPSRRAALEDAVALGLVDAGALVADGEDRVAPVGGEPDRR